MTRARPRAARPRPAPRVVVRYAVRDDPATRARVVEALRRLLAQAGGR